MPKTTVPVKVGEAKGAFKSNAACVKVDIGFAKSVVLFTFPNPKFNLAFVSFTAPVPPFETKTIPFTLEAFPVKVPTKDGAVNLLAVISPAAKFPLPSRATIVLASLSEVVFNAFETPGMDETTLCTYAVVAICVLLVDECAVGAVGIPVKAIFGAIVVVIEPEPDPVTAPIKVIEELTPELVNKSFTNAVVAI